MFVISGAWTIETKGPWPPSKFGPRKKRQYSPLDKFFWPPPEPKSWLLTLDYFSTGPPSLANLQAPLFVIAFVCTVLMAMPPTLDWLIIHGAIYFNWTIARVLSRHLQISKLSYEWRQSNRLTESNTTKRKQKVYIEFFPGEGIVLFSMEEVCGDFCSARFYLYFYTVWYCIDHTKDHTFDLKAHYEVLFFYQFQNGPRAMLSYFRPWWCRSSGHL